MWNKQTGKQMENNISPAPTVLPSFLTMDIKTWVDFNLKTSEWEILIKETKERMKHIKSDRAYILRNIGSPREIRGSTLERILNWNEFLNDEYIWLYTKLINLEGSSEFHACDPLFYDSKMKIINDEKHKEDYSKKERQRREKEREKRRKKKDKLLIPVHRPSGVGHFILVMVNLRAGYFSIHDSLYKNNEDVSHDITLLCSKLYGVKVKEVKLMEHEVMKQPDGVNCAMMTVYFMLCYHRLGYVKTFEYLRDELIMMRYLCASDILKNIDEKCVKKA